LNINVVGRREEGKTTLAMYLAASRYKGRVVFDPRGMIEGVICNGSDDLEIAIQECRWQQGPLVYRCKSSDNAEEFETCCSVLFPPGFSRGGFAFVVDESGLLQSSQGINAELLRIVKQHPTYPPRESVMVIQTNHRLAEFNNSCKALMDELYIFQTTLPRDLDVLEEHTGLPEISEIVKRLPPHHCVRYLYGRQPEGHSQYQVWSDPAVWHVRLNSAQPPVPPPTPPARKPLSVFDDEEDLHYA
jgi:hypothetical protein